MQCLEEKYTGHCIELLERLLLWRCSPIVAAGVAETLAKKGYTGGANRARIMPALHWHCDMLQLVSSCQGGRLIWDEKDAVPAASFDGAIVELTRSLEPPPDQPVMGVPEIRT
jgi:hypothetical protein